MIIGTILAGDQVIRNGSMLIDAYGRIVEVGCDLPRDSDTTIISCPGAIVSPGLVNPHDHIFYNHAAPSAPAAERYSHRHQWRLGLEGHSQPAYERATTSEQVTWSELRHVLAGTTSIAGMGGVSGLARNVEDPELIGDLQAPAAFATVFPLGDAEGRMLADGCDYPEPVSQELFAGYGAFQAHVAEGVDDRAQNEIACVMQLLEATDALPAAFVHFIASTASDAAALRDADISVVWSPRSNLALYGHTADVTLLDSTGVNIALSSDWLPSGSMNMLRELHCAADYSRDYLSGHFTDFQLWRMATANAAKSLALDDEFGSLKPGLVADVAIFRDGPATDPYADVVGANDSDIILVMRGGKVLSGRKTLLEALDLQCDALPLAMSCGEAIAVCLGANGDMQSLLAANQDSYPLMSCGEIPVDEPTCTPSWPGQFNGQLVFGTDDDGDGVDNHVDNCASVFNPPRPMDDGLQPDADRDGVGDACDEQPLE